MIRVAMIAAALVTIALSGCGTFRGGETIVKYDGQHPILSEVQSSGEYQLYATTDFNPQMTVHLKEGDPIGFKSGGTAQVLAVAGSHEFPLKSDKSYYWKRK